MKYIKKIIGLLLVLILTINLNVAISYATEPENACSDKKPDYEKLMSTWDAAIPQNQNDYEEAFEKAQLAHHNYVGCMFDFAERAVLFSEDAEGTEGAEQSGVMAANTLNTGAIPILGGLVDWMTPDQACLSDTELSKVIKKSEPSQMLKPILDAHSKYKDHLLIIGNEFDNEGILTDKKGKPLKALEALQAKTANIGTLKRQRQMEIDSSLLAIDLMFTSLKELRLSFVMHVRFQCTLKFLDKYRRALENLRNIIEPLPIQLEDASTS